MTYKKALTNVDTRDVHGVSSSNHAAINWHQDGQGAHLVPTPTSTSRAIACLVAFTLPIRTPITGWLTFGMLIAVVIAPVLLQATRRSGRATLFTVLVAFALIAGWLTREARLSVRPFTGISGQLTLYQIGLLVALLVSVYAAWWSCTVVGSRVFLTSWSAGLISYLSTIGVFQSENAWKYGLALPVTIIISVYFTRANKTHLGTAFAIIAGVSIAFSYRSWLAIAAVAFGYVIFLRVAKAGARPVARKYNLLVIGAVFSALIFGLYLLIIKLATSGALGEYVMQRTLRQERIAGNALLGGRPEWGSAVGLASENPFGFGLGVTPSSSDLSLAIRSLPVGNRSLQDGSNVAEAFRSGSFSFHSTLWNFWANYGVGGAALIIFIILLMAVLVVRLQGYSVDVGIVLPILLLCMGCIWDCLFSPTPIASIAAAVALAIHIASESRSSNLRLNQSTNRGAREVRK